MSRSWTRTIVALAALLLAAPALQHLAAQELGGGPAGRQGPGWEEQMRRQQLERRVRQNFWRISKERIGFTDEQMARLEESTRRFDLRRRALVQEERAQREILRDEILADSRADESRVAAALDRLMQLQRQRVEMQIDEQRDFATFMTPIQRAKFAALQEQLRRQVEALRRQRPDSLRRAMP